MSKKYPIRGTTYLHRATYLVRNFSWLVDPRRLVRQPELAIDRPIFLLGTQGGGLTLLSRMLHRHPDVISVGGNCDYWTAGDEMQAIFDRILPFPLGGIRHTAPPHPYLISPRSWSYGARELHELYRHTAADATDELRRALQHAIRFSAVRNAKHQDRFRFLDKSQVYTLRVGLIAKLLEDSDPRFVLVPREPYISVYRAAMGGAGDMQRLKSRLSYEERVDICAEHYTNMFRAAFEDRDAMQLDILVARFEDILKCPQEQLQKVCDFVQLEFHQDMLPQADHRFPLGSQYIDRWFPLKSDINLKYESQIDRHVIDRVNHYADKDSIVERLGYIRR